MGRKWFVLAALAGIGFYVAAMLRRQELRTFGGEWPVSFAHRGASSLAPENTLEAFRIAVEAGARGLELDVHLTHDGHLVVIHDATVDRTTSGTGAVAEMTLEELRALDAGHHFCPDGGHDRPYRGRGVRVSTLPEVLEEFPGVAVNIDIKGSLPGGEETILNVLQDGGAEGRVLVVSKYYSVVRCFREVSGGRIPTGASRLETGVFLLLSTLGLEGLIEPAYVALQVPVDYRGSTLVTRRFVEAAHARGVRVDVWTINDPGEMHRLLDLGVDVVMTDEPEALVDVLRTRDQARTSSTADDAPRSV